MRAYSAPVLAAVLVMSGHGLGASASMVPTTGLTASAAASQASENQACDRSQVQGNQPDVDMKRVMGHITSIAKITDDNSNDRSFGTPGAQAVVEYIKSQVPSTDYEVVEQEFSHDGRTGSNLIVRRTGDLESRSIVAAAYDATPGSPGANENATGVAALIEAMRHATGTRFDVEFAFITGGQAGVDHYVESMTPNHRREYRNNLSVSQLGSPNGGHFVHRLPPPGGGVAIQQDMHLLENSFNVQNVKLKTNVRTDQKSLPDFFVEHNLESMMLHSGGTKDFTEADSKLWPGRQVGKPYDGAVRTSRDDVDHLSQDVLKTNVTAVAYAAQEFSGKNLVCGPGYTFTANPTEPSLHQGDSIDVKLELGLALITPTPGTVSVEHPDSLTVSFDTTDIALQKPVTATVTVADDADLGWQTATVHYESEGLSKKAYIDVFVKAKEFPGGPECELTDKPAAAIDDHATVTRTLDVTKCAGRASRTSQVTVDIDHSYRGDLRGILTAPSGVDYLVFDRSGGGADNVKETFTVDLSEEKANGTWQFKVSDNASRDQGTLNQWTLKLS